MKYHSWSKENRIYIAICISFYLITQSGLYAQSVFKIPGKVEDFANYSSLEQCHALMHRLANREHSVSDSLSFDSLLSATQRKPYLLSTDSKESIAKCVEKFTVGEIIRIDSLRAAKDDREVFSLAIKLFSTLDDLNMLEQLIDVSMDTKDWKNYSEISTAFSHYLENPLQVSPQAGKEDSLVRALEDKYLISYIKNNSDSFDLQIKYIDILRNRLSQKLRNDDIASALNASNNLLEAINNALANPEDSLSSDYQTRLRRYKITPIYLQYRDSLLNSLRSSGLSGYIASLNRIRENIGVDTLEHNSFFVDKMFDAKGFIGYRRDSTVWKSAGSEANGIVNDPYKLVHPGKINAIYFLPALCRRIKWIPAQKRKYHRVNNMGCWRSYYEIRQMSSSYPEIEITIVTATVGHFDELALPDPYEEADLIRKAWHEYHKLPANILVEYTPKINLIPPDNRRLDDWSESNLTKIKEVIGKTQNEFSSLVLVSPEGSILRRNYWSIPGVEFKEFLNTYYSWWIDHNKAAK